MPPVIAKAFLALANESPIRRIAKDFIWERATDYAPKSSDRDYVRKSDVPWLDRFAAAGGRAIISGDVKMRHNPHEKLALYQHGFVVVFFEKQWAQWDFFQKSALMLHWWKVIIDKIKSAPNGTFWVVPCNYPKGNEQANLRNASLGLAKLLRDVPERANRPPASRPRSGRRQRMADERQSAFLATFDGAKNETEGA